MSEISDLVTDHPWWIAAAAAVAVFVAVWIVAGGDLLERRYRSDIFGPR
jgi:hypothetical protein